MKTKKHYSKRILWSVLLFFAGLAMTSCGSDDADEIKDDEEKQTVDLSTSLIGYWTGFYEKNDLSSYTFISFNTDKTYAMFLNDDAFSSGTYTIADNTVTLKSGYDETTLTLSSVVVNEKSISFKINEVSYTGNKSNKEALNLENVLIGKSYTTYLAQKPIVTTFHTRYSATRVYKRSITQTLYIYWQYIYNGKNLYVKNFESANEQHATIGGWNTYEHGKVYIYDVEMSGGNIEYWSKIEEQK